MIYKVLIIFFIINYLSWLVYSETIKENIVDSLSDNGDDSINRLLQEIMLKGLHPYKCVAVISDPIYSDIFFKSWFKRFGGLISFVIVNVDESEDLLAPNIETQNSLILAKNNGCQMYVILISNGLQVARFLKFGDRYRVLDTRANYILLFDNRIFEKKNFYLWKRIINVVFIKKYIGKKLNKGKGTSFWYELTTVPFPTNFDEVLVLRRLDIWTQSKFRKGTELFKDKTSDLRNQTLKVAAFPHLPGTVRRNSSFSERSVTTLITFNNDSYSGTEIEILKTVSQSMNFHCELYEPDNVDVELWGKKQVGEVYSGLLGEMTTARADLALGDLYYIPFMLELMDLSIPYNTECLTFVTPESLTDISWKTLILPFSPIMWTCVILCLLLSSLSFYILAKFHRNLNTEKNIKNNKNYKNRKREIELNRKIMFANLSIYSQITKIDSDLKYSILKEQYQLPKDVDDPEGLYQFYEPVNSVLYTYSMLLLVSLPKLPTGWSLRVMTGWYWLYCLLVVVAYRASMTAILARPTPTVTIDSLQELVDSRLNYMGWGEINGQFFSSSRDTSINKIIENFQTTNSSDDAMDRVAEGTAAFYENTYFLKEAVLKRQTRFQETQAGNQTNQTKMHMTDMIRSDRNLHIMKDCIINMPISIGLQKNSPLKPRVDKFIRRVLEAGLVEKWLNDVMQKILNNKVEHDSEGRKALMNLKKMYGALVVLGIGYVLGLFMVLGEIWYYNYYVIKHPGFNKYSRMVHEIKKAT